MLISGGLFLTPGQGVAAVAQDEMGVGIGCTLTPAEYQRAGYLLRQVKVDNLFNFLRVIDPLSDRPQVDLPKANAPFVVAEANRAAAALDRICCTGVRRRTARPSSSPSSSTTSSSAAEPMAHAVSISSTRR